MRITRTAVAMAVAAAMVGCAAQPEATTERRGGVAGRTATGQAPDRFTIAPDDWDVPYAGTTEDGRKFFLSDRLFASKTRNRPEAAYVGLFLWRADGTYDEVLVDEVSRPEGLPPGQAGPADAQDVVDARLAELGDYVLEPVEVEPFTEKVRGIEFGWKVGRYDDGDYYVGIVPGDFIVYYAPWDGLEYDT